MRKLVFVLFVITVPFWGTHLYWLYQKHQVRQQAKSKILEGIPKKELTLFKFTKKESQSLEWRDKNEFALNGKMYDVVEQQIIGDRIWYWCWDDTQEASLDKKMNYLMAYLLTHDTKQQKHQHLFLKYLKLWWNKTYTINLVLDWIYLTNNYLLDPPSRYTFLPVSLLSPPPELI